MKEQSDPHSRPPMERGDEEGSASDGKAAAKTYTSSAEDKTRHELQAAKESAEKIVNTIRESLLVLDLGMRVKSANRSFYDKFEVRPEATEGKLVYDLGNGQWDIPKLRELLEEILPQRKTFDDFEVEHEFEEIGTRVMLLNARRLDHLDMILLAIDDVTERRKDESRLRDSQERFDLLVENAREYAIFMMDENTHITMWNPGAERILGWSEEEIIGQTGDVIFTPEDREAGVPEKEVSRAKSHGSALDDRWHVRKDGRRFWATGFMVALRRDGELRGLAKILRDDTEMKESEAKREALLTELEEERSELRALNETLEDRVEERTSQVRSLASTLTMAEQQERRRISQILHDDLQQLLYALQMKMVYVRKAAESGDREQIEREARQVEEWLSRAVDTTRRLTVDLSPPILKDEGLVDALGWLTRQMKEVHDLQVDLRAEHPFLINDDDIRVLLFQVVRELLFNVVKHADTRRATVELVQRDGYFSIIVTDAGNGFNVKEAAQRSENVNGGGFGLFSVRERLALFGGHMEIESSPGKGTRVAVYTPLSLASSSKKEEEHRDE